MAKLKLLAEPTFTAKVGIPVAGGEPVMVQMTFKHRTKTQLDEWVASRNHEKPAQGFLEAVRTWEAAGILKPESAAALTSALDTFIKANPSKTDSESFMDMVIGWELADPFTVESVDLLLENYFGAGLATYRVYVEELLASKTKN